MQTQLLLKYAPEKIILLSLQTVAGKRGEPMQPFSSVRRAKQVSFCGVLKGIMKHNTFNKRLIPPNRFVVRDPLKSIMTMTMISQRSTNNYSRGTLKSSDESCSLKNIKSRIKNSIKISCKIFQHMQCISIHNLNDLSLF